MTEANLWPSWLSHIYCLHSSGEVCTQFQEKKIYLTMLGATYTSLACKQFNDKPVVHSSRLRWMLGTAFTGCRVSKYKTSGMLHHLGMSLSESKSNSCVGDHTCWHTAIYPVGSATMATQGQVPHSNCEHAEGFLLCMSGRASSSCMVLVMWLAASLVSYLTDIHSINLSGSKLPCVLWMHSTWVIFAPCGSFHTNAIVLK